jgi:dCTP deaminase
MKKGALPSQKIRELILAGNIKGINEENISPASLDLSISSEVYRVEGIFLPKKNENVRDILKHGHIGAIKFDLLSPMEKNVTYLAKLNEELELPDDIYGYCNPKSTTGRNDIHVRVLANKVSRYDTVTPKGYEGELWVAITPKSFPVKMAAGQPLTQIRFFNDDTRFTEKELKENMESQKLLWSLDGRCYGYDDINIKDSDGSIILTLDLSQNIIGYKGRRTNKLLDLTKGVNSHNMEDFFEPVRKYDDCIHLQKGGFYILSTNQAVRVPPDFACEMAPMDERSGEFRSHYAGFFDPGWGYGKDGEGKGRPITLELRPFEDLIIRHAQPIGRIKYEKMIETPEISYDSKETSNYKVQVGPKLSKYFKN